MCARACAHTFMCWAGQQIMSLLQEHLTLWVAGQVTFQPWAWPLCPTVFSAPCRAAVPSPTHSPPSSLSLWPSHSFLHPHLCIRAALRQNCEKKAHVNTKFWWLSRRLFFTGHSTFRAEGRRWIAQHTMGGKPTLTEGPCSLSTEGQISQAKSIFPKPWACLTVKCFHKIK